MYENGGVILGNIWMFLKIGVPQIINFNRGFHYKPSILGYPYFLKHPYILNFATGLSEVSLTSGDILRVKKSRFSSEVGALKNCFT